MHTFFIKEACVRAAYQSTFFRKPRISLPNTCKAKMLRHKGFETEDSLNSFLSSTTPSDVYYSYACFERSEADVDEKG